VSAKRAFEVSVAAIAKKNTCLLDDFSDLKKTLKKEWVVIGTELSYKLLDPV
jgi:hypothetical protein